MRSTIKFLSETLPLAAFFIGYKFFDLIFATEALVVATVIAVMALYLLERKIPVMPLVSAAVVGFFGALTIFSGNPLFIKIKPTIINSLFAAILLGGVLFNKGMLKYIAGSALQLTDEGWMKLSLRFALFFLCLAALNEVIWRNFPEAFWVKFKVFGMLPITMIFTALQMQFIKKHSKEN